MAGLIQRKVMKQLRNLWLTEFTKEVNKFREKEGKAPVQITDCITLSFYIFDFLPPGASKEGSKETGALACTFTSFKCPPEELDAKEIESLHKLVDSLKLEQGYNVNDIKDISATLNFQDWSIQANVTLKAIDPETKKNVCDSQIWK